jgi:hypothetical protein
MDMASTIHAVGLMVADLRGLLGTAGTPVVPPLVVLKKSAMFTQYPRGHNIT